MENIVPPTFHRRCDQRLAADDRHFHDVTLLALDIIEQFMAGMQPRRLTLMWFQRNRLMVDWQAQRQLIASFEEDV